MACRSLQKDPATVSKWCTNVSQPSIETLVEIARVLEVDVKDLLVSTTNDSVYIKIPKVWLNSDSPIDFLLYGYHPW